MHVIKKGEGREARGEEKKGNNNFAANGYIMKTQKVRGRKP